MSEQFQRNLPDHLKPYAGNYVNQQLGQATGNALIPNAHVMQPKELTSRPPIPNTLKRDHAIPFGEQHTVELNTLPTASQTMFENQTGRAYVPQNLDPNQPPAQQTPSSQYHEGYDFIMNSDKPTRKSRGLPSLPGLNPIIGRVLVVAIGLLFLIIIFAVIKNIASGPSNYPALLSVLQDQNELLHIAGTADTEPDISVNNQSFVSTINLVVGDSSSKLATYIVSNGHKPTLQEEDLKVSTTVDQNIASAESTGDFNSVFSQLASSQLKTYISDLNNAYNVTKGPNGRALLSSDYKQAVLLKKVLDSNNANGTI
jgi:hypothetical protein